MASKKKLDKVEQPYQKADAAGVSTDIIPGAGVEEISNAGPLEGDLIPAGAVIGGAIADPDDLDALYNELEAGLEPVNLTPAENKAIEAGAVTEIGELKAAAAEELAQEAAAAGTPTVTPVANEPAKGKAPTTKRISTLGLKKSVAIVQALGAKAPDFLTINLADATLSDAEQAEKREEFLKQIDALPVKIQEKVVNFYAHVAQGATLSNYTVMAIKLLIKDGELTSKSLKDAYIARPYTEGTASSQATQMMKLLPLLGLAKRNGSKLVVNSDSVLLPSLNVAS
jgi:hypothetical protein